MPQVSQKSGARYQGRIIYLGALQDEWPEFWQALYRSRETDGFQRWCADFRVTQPWLIEAALQTLNFWEANPSFVLDGKNLEIPEAPAPPWFRYADPDPLRQVENFEMDLPRSISIPNAENGAYSHSLESLSSYRSRVMQEFRERLTERCAYLQRRLYWNEPSTWLRDARWAAQIWSGKTPDEIAASEADCSVKEVQGAVRRFARDIELKLSWGQPRQELA